MIAISVGVPYATAIRKARPVVTNPPMYGMKQAMNDRIATGTAKGRPSSSMMTSCEIAPTAEMAAVPSM